MRLAFKLLASDLIVPLLGVSVTAELVRLMWQRKVVSTITIIKG